MTPQEYTLKKNQIIFSYTHLNLIPGICQEVTFKATEKMVTEMQTYLKRDIENKVNADELLTMEICLYCIKFHKPTARKKHECAECPMYKENDYCNADNSSFDKIAEEIDQEDFNIKPLRQEITDLVKEFVEANKSLVKESVYVYR